MAAIIGAEAIAAAVSPEAGAVCDAVVLLGLLKAHALSVPRPESRLFALLALVPLLRILSLTMPIRHIAEIWWYAMVGAPLLLAAFLATRAVPISWPGLRLQEGRARGQAAIALTGVPLGAAAYGILSPAPLISPLSVPSLIGASLMLIVFSALSEEVVFRGLLQSAARELFGGAGLVIVSVLYASLYIGSLSAAYVAFSGAVGLAFAVAVERTGALWGAIGARSMLIVGLLLVWPAVYG